MSRDKEWVSACSALMPFCCGIFELGNLQIYGTRNKPPQLDADDDGGRYYQLIGSGATEEAAWKDLIDNFRQHIRKSHYVWKGNQEVAVETYRPVVINFVCYRNGDDFEAETLRKLVESQAFGPARKMHNWFNPNSYNTLESWFLENGSEL